MEHLKKISWQQYCVDLELYHKGQVANTRVLVIQGKLAREWSIRDTARETCRSIGKVSEDLRLAEGMRIWPSIEKCQTRALALIELFRKIAEREKREAERKKQLDQNIKEAEAWRPKPNILDELT